MAKKVFPISDVTAATEQTAQLPIEDDALVSAHIVWSGLDQNDATVQIQTDNTGDVSNANNKAGAVHTLNPGAGGNKMISMTQVSEAFINALYTRNSANTAGSVSIHFNSKK